MKIAIATEQDRVSEHFGRCAMYTFFNIENNVIIEKTTLNNPGHAPGAIPKFLKDNKVDILITGGIGARAIGFFKQLEIGVIQGVEGLIEDVIKNYLTGVLKIGVSPCNPGAGKGYGIDKEECDHDEKDHIH